MSGPRYLPLSRLLAVVALATLWGSTVALRLLWTVLRQGRTKVFHAKTRDIRPAVLDDPQNGSHHFARLKTVRLHYVAIGQEGRPLMLFLHGFPELWYSWRFQLRELGKHFRAVAVDMRGYGESDKPEAVADYHADKLTGDVKELVEYLGYEKCYLVGHDWGGVVAWDVAAKYPDLVEKLIVCNMPNPSVFRKHLWSSRSQLLKSWYVFFFQIPHFPEIFLGTSDLAFLKASFTSKKMGVKSENFSEEDLEAFKYTFKTTTDRRGPLNYYRAIMRYEQDAAYKRKVQCPTLIVWGTRDVALERAMVGPSSDYVTGQCVTCFVEGASHWVQQDEPELVNRYILDFVNGRNSVKI